MRLQDKGSFVFTGTLSSLVQYAFKEDQYRLSNHFAFRHYFSGTIWLLSALGCLHSYALLGLKEAVIFCVPSSAVGYYKANRQALLCPS